MAEIERDEITGRETTGHEWDGIKELNTPLPKWWSYTFYATIVWSLVYWVLYPAWPTLTDFTKGTLGYSSRAEHRAEMSSAMEGRAAWAAKFENMGVGEIAGDQQLLNYAMAGGKFVFAENCAPCHGSAGSGAPAYPVLADDDWIWGGTVDDIYATIRYGVRSGHEDGRESDMPNFVADEILTNDQVNDVTEFVLSLSGAGSDAASAGRGMAVFAEQCVACHGEDGRGITETGGPNLTDGIWLYSEGKEAIQAQIAKPRHGVMPAWEGRLDDVTIKQVSVYVHTLGGGQ